MAGINIQHIRVDCND